MPRFVLVFAAATVMLLPGSVVGALIVNPGFESPDIPSGSFSIFGAIPGWTLTFGPGIEIQDNVAGAPFEGDQFVELDSLSNSGISQTIPTVPGASYLLGFVYSPRPGIAVGDNTIEVYFDFALVDTLDGAGAGTTVWSSKQYVVTATGAVAVLEFRATGTSNSLGGYLDAVELAQLVEIDVKPGSDPNCFNVDGNGVIPVATLGSETFDVSQIDTLTLLFAGLDTRVRGKKGPLCSIKEVNGDAFPDLVCQFEDDASAWTAGTTEAELSGNLLDGTPFEGTDSICIENRNLPPTD